MKRVSIILLILLIFPFVSADIIINTQPTDVYNLGDAITIPATVKSSSDMSGVLNMDLLCSGQTLNFYKNGISLDAGDEKKVEASLVLRKNIIGELKGTCKIKASVGDDFVLTKDFKISDLLTLVLDFEKIDFNPEETIALEGTAVKENGKDVNGYVTLNIYQGNASKISQQGTIKNGFFSISSNIPKNMEAGTYLLRVEVYEEDNSKEKTNKGFVNQNIFIKQIPTSLEILFDNYEVQPGTNLRVKTILHDQTGEKINSTSFLTIKNNNDKILEQLEIATDEFFEVPIKYNEAPLEWKVVAVSHKLTTESKFKIAEKKSVEVNLINKTVIIKNTGNVPYNDTVLVKIGEESLNIDVYVPVGSEQKYILTAPDGKYEVKIITGNETTTASLLLTGKTIDIKEASNKIASLAKYPFAWIFIIVILGFVTFLVFQKGHRKTFFGYISSKLPKRNKYGKISESGGEFLSKNSLIKSRNKAELSLSIKGHKQNISMVSLKVKNLKELQTKESNASEILQKIVDFAEENKAFTYENNNDLFFLLIPTKTKTFGNEKIALNISRKAGGIINEYNKMAKQKIEFGISLNYGTIVSDSERKSNTLKFMTLGNLMNSSKKMASMSKSQILLDEKIKDKLKSHLKTEKHEHAGMKVYTIKEIKNPEEHEKFIKHFLKGLEKDKAEKEKD